MMPIAATAITSFFQNLPEIIKAASASLLGLCALIILVWGFLGFFFFYKSHEHTRIKMFILIVVGTSMLIIAISTQDSGSISANCKDTLKKAQAIDTEATNAPATVKTLADLKINQDSQARTVRLLEGLAPSGCGGEVVQILEQNREKLADLNSRIDREQQAQETLASAEEQAQIAVKQANDATTYNQLKSARMQLAGAEDKLGQVLQGNREILIAEKIQSRQRDYQAEISKMDQKLDEARGRTHCKILLYGECVEWVFNLPSMTN